MASGKAGSLHQEQPTATKRYWSMTRSADQKKLETYYHQIRVAVVLVKNGETKERAWQRYKGEHPEYNKKDVRIFHFAPEELSEDFALHHVERLARRIEDGNKRNPAGRCESAD
jgi:hypothetical protein